MSCICIWPVGYLLREWNFPQNSTPLLQKYRRYPAISDPNWERTHHRQTFYSDLLLSGVCFIQRNGWDTRPHDGWCFSYLQLPGFPFRLVLMLSVHLLNASMCVHITASPLLCRKLWHRHLCVKATYLGSQGTWLTSWLMGCNTALFMSKSLILPDSLVESWFFFFL